MTEYDKYNREERAICSHLFRLLHESLDEKWDSPYGRLVKLIMARKSVLNETRRKPYIPEFENIGIYTEVALIRDHYYTKRADPFSFMDDLISLIMRQEDVTEDCRIYSELSELDIELNQPWKTHPKQIRLKASQKQIPLSVNESKVYGALQGMFNAKPDLVLTIDNMLIVVEAKFTEKFDKEQLTRTQKIAQVWSELLHKELGFNEKPDIVLVTLGSEIYKPDVSWTDIYNIAKDFYLPTDKTLIAFTLGLELLNKKQRVS